MQSLMSQTNRGSNSAQTPVEVGPNPRRTVQQTAHTDRQHPVPSPSSNFFLDFENMCMDAASASRQTPANTETLFERMRYDSGPSSAPSASNSGDGSVSSVSDMHYDTLFSDRVTADLDTPCTVFSLIDENAVQNGEEHPQVGDNDRPFTYLASLSTKWANSKRTYLFCLRKS